jgi:hypothetical protein
MSQGTVKTTPRPGAPGTVNITVADSNPYGVRAGATLSFTDSGYAVNDNVNCDITSATTCRVTGKR